MALQPLRAGSDTEPAASKASIPASVSGRHQKAMLRTPGRGNWAMPPQECSEVRAKGITVYPPGASRMNRTITTTKLKRYHSFYS